MSKIALLECTTLTDSKEREACIDALKTTPKKNDEQLFKIAEAQDKKSLPTNPPKIDG